MSDPGLAGGHWQLSERSDFANEAKISHRPVDPGVRLTTGIPILRLKREPFPATIAVMKTRQILFLVFMVLMISVLSASTTKKPSDSPAAVFLRYAVACLNHAEAGIGGMTAAVDETAKRMTVGGEIYLSDDETSGGFASEGAYRAGGLRHVKLLLADGRVEWNDIILVGTLDLHPAEQMKQLSRLRREGGPLIVLFGSRSSKLARLADYVIDNGLPSGIVPVMSVSGGERIGPIAGIANVTHMWTFTAELVAALTRMGKMPSMLQSILVPGSHEWNRRVGEFRFHPDSTIPPIRAGVLGRSYLRSLRESFARIESDELKKFADAGKLCADAFCSGHRLLASTLSHFMPTQARMKGFPPIFSWFDDNARNGDSLKGRASSGDVWLMIGYSYYPLQELTYLREAGAKSVALFVPGPAVFGEGSPVEPDPTLIDLYIDPHWRQGDGVVSVPGYGPRIIPVSGVIMASCYWMVIGEIMNRMSLAREFSPAGGFTAGIEGPACDREGNLYCVACRDRRDIARVTPDGRVSVFAFLPEGSFGNGIRFDSRGRMLVADYTGHNILVVDRKSLAVAALAHEPRMNQPNDLAITSSDIVFASDPDWKNSTGQLWRVDRSGRTTLLESNMGTTNGIEVSPDDRRLYVGESVQRRIWVYDLSPAGDVSRKRLFASFPDAGLDGMRCDSAGNLYVTRHGRGTVAVISPRGEMIREIRLAGKNPTNIAFGGADGRTCYVTVADRGNIETFRTDHPGRSWRLWRRGSQ